jgi:hypothetical protein
VPAPGRRINGPALGPCGLWYRSSMCPVRRLSRRNTSAFGNPSPIIFPAANKFPSLKKAVNSMSVSMFGKADNPTQNPLCSGVATLHMDAEHDAARGAL